MRSGSAGRLVHLLLSPSHGICLCVSCSSHLSHVVGRASKQSGFRRQVLEWGGRRLSDPSLHQPPRKSPASVRPACAPAGQKSKALSLVRFHCHCRSRLRLVSGAGVTALHFVAGRVPPSHRHSPRGACLENSKEGGSQNPTWITQIFTLILDEEWNPERASSQTPSHCPVGPPLLPFQERGRGAAGQITNQMSLFIFHYNSASRTLKVEENELEGTLALFFYQA